MLQRFRRRSTLRRVRGLLEEGVGVRETIWTLESVDDPTTLADGVVRWVQNAMSGMRRPNGIDHVAFALACRNANGDVRSSSTFGVSRPTEFYEDTALERVTGFLTDLEAVPATERHEVVGALICLGDLAYRIELDRAA